MRVDGCCIPKLTVIGWRIWGGTIGGEFWDGFFYDGCFARTSIEPGGRRLDIYVKRTTK